MTIRDPRRLAIAEFAATVLDAAPRPDHEPRSTYEIALRLGAVSGGWVDPRVIRALHNLSRRQLAEPVGELRGGERYWRQTQAGAAWDGTVEQLARPVRWRP